MERHLCLILLAVACASALVSDFSRCPRYCTCLRQRARKVVMCDHGDLPTIPTSEIDKDTHVLRISAPSSRPNYLVLGRLFLELKDLEEISITHSNIPFIGDGSFLPGTSLRKLDLSSNNISVILDSNFQGLSNLQTLILDDNKINNIVSAVFRHLSNLTTLSLARNNLQNFSPRIFFRLPKLQTLNLKGNPLKDIDPEHLKDLTPLKTLILSDCQLNRLHSLFYQTLANLEELDLSNNRFKVFQPDEFRHVKKLRVLKLDGNVLNVVVDKTFDGHNLTYLGLSRNEILSIYSCAFCNSSIKELDLSNNHMETFNTDALKPIALSLQSLNIGSNSFSTSLITSILKPLRLLTTLNLSNMKIDMIPDELLYYNPYIKNLSFAENRLEYISHKVIAPLKDLEVLDLSRNKFKTLNNEFLTYLQGLENFYRIELYANPWSCSKCSMDHMLKWLNATKFHKCSEEHSDLSVKCARCSNPLVLSGRYLQTLRSEDLEDCALPLTQPRSSNALFSEIPILISVVLVILIIVVLVCILYAHCVKGAVYYTHEDEKRHVTLCENGEVSDKTAMYVQAVDIYNDYPKKKQAVKNGIS